MVREFKPPRRLLLDQLPDRLKNRPDIRALTLRVIEEGHHYLVPGRQRVYCVSIFGDYLRCDCVAAQMNRECAHVIAARHYHEGKFGPMKIAGRRVDSSEGQSRQVVRIKTKGIYGGMFSRYTQPAMFKRIGDEGTEEKFFVTFVVTHDAAGRKLDHFTEAFTGIRTKIFYDSGKNMMSAYVAFLSAILHPKCTAAEIAGKDFEPPDLDDLIGRPARLYLKPGAKPNSKGLYVNQIDGTAGGFDPADQDLIKAIKPMYAAKTIGQFPDGTSYLDSPRAVYEDELPVEELITHYSPSVVAEEDDGIPF